VARLLPAHDARLSDQLKNGLTKFRTAQRTNAQGELEVSRVIDPVTNQAMTLEWLVDNFDKSTEKAFDREKNLTAAMMVHQRTLEKARQLGRSSNISGLGAGMESDVRSANRFLAALERNPALKAKLVENARRYRMWANHHLKMLVEAGRLTSDAYNQIKRNNTQYVAMNRISEEFDVAHGGSSSNAIAGAKQPIETFKGSALQIKEVYGSLLNQTNLIQKEVFRNAAMRSFVDGFINVRQIHGPKRMDLAQFGSRATSKDPNSIKVWRNGKVEYWKFSKDINESLKGLGDLGSHQFIELLSKPSQFTRWMITHSPAFIVRNVMRDAVQRAVVSGNQSKPWDILRGIPRLSQDAERYNAFGGGQFGHYNMDKNVWERELDRITDELVKDPKNIVIRSWRKARKVGKAYGDLAQSSEILGRVAEFRRAFDAGKKRGYDDYNAALFAASEARGILDFAKAGIVMRVINKLIPFSNARLRGLARSTFQFKEHPARTLMNWAQFVLLPTLITWAINQKDDETREEYQQLPAYRKDFFWNFKIGHHWYSIPRPHELGVMAALVERSLNAVFGGDKHAYEGHGKSLINSYFPVGSLAEMTGPLRTALELNFNRDSFRRRDIVPSWEKDLDLELRKGTPTASAAGRGLAAVANVTGLETDPRQWDYLINSYGGWGQMATTVTSDKRTWGEFAGKTVGLQSEVPGSAARDVQWNLEWAKNKGFTNHQLIKDLKKLREDVLNEKNPAARDAKSRTLRAHAIKVREVAEQYNKEQAAQKKKAP
jgi:hypothetical protein